MYSMVMKSVGEYIPKVLRFVMSLQGFIGNQVLFGDKIGVRIW